MERQYWRVAARLALIEVKRAGPAHWHGPRGATRLDPDQCPGPDAALASMHRIPADVDPHGRRTTIPCPSQNDAPSL
ncbi:hypothetical protein [Salinisphaera orenii]|uniref:hypothetical protein n=1 Tax=Salinisphaera orenii TaxID=856731 RepID=UPI0013A5FE4E